MMRGAMRGLFLFGVMCWLGSSSAEAQETTPVDCGTVECEGIREMRALFMRQRNSLQERDLYSWDLEEVGFSPAPCADGSRAPVPPERGWVAGCHFIYRMTGVTNMVDYPLPSSFSAMARGREGSPAEGLVLRIGMTASAEGRTFSLEGRNHRRAVGWDECLPAESFTCAAQLREGLQDIRVLFITERALLQEKDRFSTDFAELGFLPDGCTTGARPRGPDSSWLGGCRFIYHVDLTATGFTATARAISGTIEGTQLAMDEWGRLTVSSLPWACE